MSEDEILKNLEDLLKKSSCGNYPPEFYLDNREALERFIRLIPSWKRKEHWINARTRNKKMGKNKRKWRSRTSILY